MAASGPASVALPLGLGTPAGGAAESQDQALTSNSATPAIRMRRRPLDLPAKRRNWGPQLDGNSGVRYVGTPMQPKSQNITWHPGQHERAERERLHGHRGATLWFTGLSGSGKSTVARRVEVLLAERRAFVYTLDGDNVRYGLCSDLGFSAEDRTENIRRIGEVCKLFTDAGTLTLAAFVSPYRADRDRVRSILAPGDFIEVYVAADLAACEARDPKGLYKKARAGEIADFTGISAPYEAPERPEITLQTDQESVDQSAQRVIRYLEQVGALPAR